MKQQSVCEIAVTPFKSIDKLLKCIVYISVMLWMWAQASSYKVNTSTITGVQCVVMSTTDSISQEFHALTRMINCRYLP